MALRWLARGVDDVPATGEWLSAAEAARLETLRFPKRLTEVRLARWTAKQGIARVLGLGDDPATLASIEVRPATTGAPVAFVDDQPAPLTLSMTDRADWAVCMVGPPDVATGCDLELVEPRSPAFVGDWLTPAEQDLVRGARSTDRQHLLANLVWSAKESGLKVLQTGLRRPTRSVEVDVIDTHGHEAWARLAVHLAEGQVLHGWWRRYDRFVLTVATDTRTAPPTGIEEPPRLSTATPSHTWLT